MTYQQKQHLMMLISLKMDESDDDSTNWPLILKLTIVMVGNLHTIVPAASHISI
jgi:hypothetical protein